MEDDPQGDTTKEISQRTTPPSHEPAKWLRGLAGKTHERLQMFRTKEEHPHEEMDIDTARSILQTIVDTHEDTISKITDRIGGHTTEQIRRATRLVAQSVIDSHDPTIFTGFAKTSQVQKDTPQGELVLQLNEGTKTPKGSTTPSVRLSLLSSTDSILENQFPLSDTPVIPEFYGYRNRRSGRRESHTLLSLGRDPTVEEFRHMVRGVRWMNANILAWDSPTTIMPEQLNNKALPHVSPSDSSPS